MRVPAVFVLSLAATLTACGSDDSTGPSDIFAGTYTLRTINGQSLPFLHFQVETTSIDVVSDTLVVAGSGNAGSFTKKMEIRVTASGQTRDQPINDAGVYTRNGTEATFQFDSSLGGCLFCNSDSTAVGTIGGDEIAFSDAGGWVFVYRK